MPDISIRAYTRSEDIRKRLHVKTYHIPPQPPQMEVRVGDVCFYMSVEDARVMAETMLTQLKVAAA